MTKFHDFRITAPGAHGKANKVFIDGKELRGVTSVDVRMSSTDANRITIEFIAGSINDETELLALLKEEMP